MRSLLFLFCLTLASVTKAQVRDIVLPQNLHGARTSTSGWFATPIQPAVNLIARWRKRASSKLAHSDAPASGSLSECSDNGLALTDYADVYWLHDVDLGRGALASSAL
jgi:transcription elongation factor